MRHALTPGTVPAASMPAAPRPRAARLKRAEDLLVAGAALTLAAPPLALLALAVKLDSPGPVVFRQPRVGRNGRLFPLFKLRTMHHAAADPGGRRLARPGDPRITRVGRVLRPTRLDELPQLVNVLRGEMSVVGPRPHAIHARAGGLRYPEAVAGYARRHAVRPGITGLAQVRGWCGTTHSVAQLRGRVACDRAYIARWSLRLDLAILLATPLALARGR
ncbi:Sugar transferase involved in LPS biosynthesis (colanic, teichoic acid) [Limimonas halophila]|uniref:Sugar transferase involved in LPS biosynthesis (Colanic, teichoic acid) n=1 Tax=Limimonas halophila TaxID=1082479 RepID=A0A1G7RXF5_9PROT|nr:sugar transferase [Limimonas halophila]SDG15421.1 Sugar transferase involved in LPS biosynthesis (colanic, teichoic acid) [Limimonas halophila]